MKKQRMTLKKIVKMKNVQNRTQKRASFLYSVLDTIDYKPMDCTVVDQSEALCRQVDDKAAAELSFGPC